MSLRHTLAAATVAVVATLVPVTAPAQAAKATKAAKAPASVPLAAPAEAKALAADAYIFTFPLLQTFRELDRQQHDASAADYVGGFNRFAHQAALPSPKDATIRRRSYDAPYSRAWLDLRAEPMVFEFPALPAGRFAVAQWFDLWGHNLAHVSSRAAAGKAQRLLIAGPDWKGPPPRGIDRVVQSSTSLVGGTLRVAAATPGDGASVAALQAQFRLQPLSAFLKRSAPKAAPALTLPRWDEARGDGRDFVAYVNALLPYVAPDPAEAMALRRFAAIGVGAGRAFDAAKLDPALAAAIEGGVAEAKAKLEKAMADARGAVDPVGTREAYGGDPMKRAVSAGFDLHRTAREEIAEFPITGDGGGDPFEKGAKYVLRFPPGQLPPVDGFWSLEMITVPTVGFVANPLDRYVIDSRQADLAKAADGAIEITIARDDPGGALTTNWLPAPDAGFSLTLRLYAPKAEAVDGRWKPAYPNRVTR